MTPEKLDNTYRKIFREYYSGLLYYATRLLGDEDAEDVVQDAFVELWKSKSPCDKEHSKALLYKIVYNKSINILKHRKVERNYCSAMERIIESKLDYYSPDNSFISEKIENKELRVELRDAVKGLPEKCRKVFVLSYLYGLKNQQIADVESISVRTVEAHMYKALKLLRNKLSHLVILALIFLFS